MKNKNLKYVTGYIKSLSLIACCAGSIGLGATAMAQGLNELRSDSAPSGSSKELPADFMSRLTESMNANTGSVTLCDKLTANKHDPKRTAKPVKFKYLKADIALVACKSDMKKDPKNPRLMLQLGRVYNKKKDYAASLSWTQKAMKAGYPYAYHVLALHYNYGEGVEKNSDKENEFYMQAADKGIEVSAMNLAAYELGVPVQSISFTRALEYLIKAGEAQGVASATWEVYCRKKSERYLQNHFILDWKNIIKNKDTDKIGTLAPIALRGYLNLLDSALSHYSDYLAQNKSKKNKKYYEKLKSYREKFKE